MNNRIKNKQITGNLTGEGLIKGGLLLISSTKGIVYKKVEVTGSEIPCSELSTVLSTLTNNNNNNNNISSNNKDNNNNNKNITDNNNFEINKDNKNNNNTTNIENQENNEEF